MVHKDERKAVLNGRIVGVGEKIELYTVLKIGGESVILNDGNGDVEIKLSK